MANPYQNFPVRAMERTRIETTLGDIFELDLSEDPQPKYLNSKPRRQNGMKYRIPEHQRHPQWKEDQKNLLIDTIFRNYPMSGITVSQHIEDNEMYFDLEDGQTRLSVLQEFYMNRFPFTFDGYTKEFQELPSAIQRRFENYKITIEILSDLDEEGHDISESFDRLQNGSPLSDKDLYWNRKDQYPLVSKAINIINEQYWSSGHMNTSNGITDKNRGQLPHVVTLIYAIINYHGMLAQEPQVTKRKTFTKSFRSQAQKLKNEISEVDNARIQKFLTYLNEIISDVYETLPRFDGEKVNIWGDLGKQTGMILREWLDNENADEAVMEANQEKWVEMMNLERMSGDLMYRGLRTMWNGMTSAAKQNTSDASIGARLQRVNEFYANREETAKNNAIIYNLNVDGVEEVEEEVAFETDSE